MISDSTYGWLLAWIKFLHWLRRPDHTRVLLIDNQVEKELIFKIIKNPRASLQRILANHNCRILTSLPTRKGKQLLSLLQSFLPKQLPSSAELTGSPIFPGRGDPNSWVTPKNRRDSQLNLRNVRLRVQLYYLSGYLKMPHGKENTDGQHTGNRI